MANPFIPEFQGDLELARVPDDFVARVRKRVEEGLLAPGNRRRANYSILSAGRDEIAFRAGDLLTAYSIGLNDVSLERRGVNAVHYHVTFWRWTWTAVTHGLLLGVGMLACVLTIPEMRRQVIDYPQGRFLFAEMLVFWCFLWPWMLTAIHRKFAEKALRRILVETMS